MYTYIYTLLYVYIFVYVYVHYKYVYYAVVFIVEQYTYGRRQIPEGMLNVERSNFPS